MMAKCAPSIITSKPKFHLLLHVTEYIRRFGPAILFSSERFESFNRIFRISSILSNKLSPSRDILIRFLHLERFKHIVLGGWWKEDTSGHWVHSSSQLSDHLRSHPDHARLLGLFEREENTPGKHCRLFSVYSEKTCNTVC